MLIGKNEKKTSGWDGGGRGIAAIVDTREKVDVSGAGKIRVASMRVMKCGVMSKATAMVIGGSIVATVAVCTYCRVSE